MLCHQAALRVWAWWMNLGHPLPGPASRLGVLLDGHCLGDNLWCRPGQNLVSVYCRQAWQSPSTFFFRGLISSVPLLGRMNQARQSLV